MKKPISTIALVAWVAFVLGAVYLQVKFADSVRYHSETEDYGKTLTEPYVAKIRDVDVQGLKQLLGIAGNPPETMPKRQGTLVYIYASWCSYCQQHFPVMQSLQAAVEQVGVKMLAISVDSDKSSLGKFVRYFQPTLQPLTPYRIPSGMVKQVLTPMGSTFTGGVPYTMLVDAKGAIRFQDSGQVAKSRILQEVDALVKSK